MSIGIPPIVAVDVNVLVWGIRSDGPEDKCKRAKWLLNQFTQHKTQVILPSVALSEYLTFIHPAGHANIIETLEERFLIPPFDKDCAALAAELFDLGQRLRTKGEEGGRAILRADSLIIATAKTFGAGMLFSGNKDCRDLSNRNSLLLAEDLPEPPKDLYGEYVV